MIDPTDGDARRALYTQSAKSLGEALYGLADAGRMLAQSELTGSVLLSVELVEAGIIMRAAYDALRRTAEDFGATDEDFDSPVF